MPGYDYSEDRRAMRALKNGPSPEDYERARRLVKYAEDVDSALVPHTPVVIQGALSCNCGAQMTDLTNEDRAAAFLAHRRTPNVPIPGVKMPNQVVPDDATPPGTMTVWTMQVTGYTAESIVHENVEEWLWDESALHVKTDTAEHLYPAHIIHHARFEEG